MKSRNYINQIKFDPSAACSKTCQIVEHACGDGELQKYKKKMITEVEFDLLSNL